MVKLSYPTNLDGLVTTPRGRSIMTGYVVDRPIMVDGHARDYILLPKIRDVVDPQAAVDGRQSSLKTVEWEQIHKTLVETDFNISETVRRLGMHRRTLARKLEKQQLR